MNIEEIARTAIEKYRARQHLPELVEFLSWLHALEPKPSFVVEVGVYKGGNLWAMQQVAPDAQYIAVDCTFHRLTDCPLKTGPVLVCGKWDALHEKIRRMHTPAEALVYIDADHSYSAAKRDSIHYPARYQVFHDVMDTRKAHVKRLVCHLYQELQKEFIAVFSHSADQVGIGVRKLPQMQ